MISIIIVTYNSARDIVACLAALFQHTHQPFEVVVYDNGSTDGTVALVKERYSDVHLMEGQSNIGFSTANNRAVERACGEFLAFLNPDTIVEAGWLPPLLQALKSDASVGAVTPKIVFANNPALVNAEGNAIHFSGITYCRGFGTPACNSKSIEVGAVSGAAFLMRRNVFQSLGGFENHFFMYFEDTHLSLKIRCAGLRCLSVNRSIVRHRYNSSVNERKIFYLERNRYLSLFILMPWRIILLMIPSLMLMEFVSWGYCLVRGPKALAAKAAAWKHLIQDRAWIRDQRRKNGHSNGVASRFLLDVFSPTLKVEYIGPGSPLLYRAIEAVGWLAAAPMLAIARRIV